MAHEIWVRLPLGDGIAVAQPANRLRQLNERALKVAPDVSMVQGAGFCIPIVIPTKFRVVEGVVATTNVAVGR
jgi:hypothetical protein